MPRQWLSPPENMCIQHRINEHTETHQFLSHMHKNVPLDAFRERSMFFGADYVKFRHDLLVPHLENHSTPLNIEPKLREKYPLSQPTIDDVTKAVEALVKNCEYCLANHI